MKDIIERLKSGDLERDWDESYSNGFWDLAGELSRKEDGMPNEVIQENVYNALYELYELMEKIKKDE